MRRTLVLTMIAIALLTTPVSSSWEVGLWQGIVPLRSPFFSGEVAELVDAEGDHYQIRARQSGTDGAGLTGLTVTAPVVSLGRTDLVLEFAGAGLMFTPAMVDGFGMYSGVFWGGPLIRMPVGDETELEAGVLAVGATMRLPADRLAAVRIEDDGFVSGGEVVPPGSVIVAGASDAGAAYVLSGRWMVSENWALRVRVMQTVGLGFSEYTYSAKSRDGEAVDFDLPQLKHIDLSGTGILLSMAYTF